MKMNNIFKTFLAVSSLVVVSCQTWYDDHNFEGYKEGSAIINIISQEYTLTDDDYVAIANNSTNKAIAEAEGVSDLLAGLKTWKTFGETISAEKYMPAFIAANWSAADDGSSLNITYRNAGDIPEEISKIVSAPLFTLAKEDYQTIWGSDEDYIESLTPNTVSKITKVLPSDGLDAGDYTIVTYNYAESEPSFSTVPGPTFTYTSVLGVAAVGETVSVTACVTGISSQGVIVTDLTGSVLLYKASGYVLGDVLTIDGKITSYNKGMQIAALDSTVEKVATDTPKYEMPTIVNSNIFDNFLKRSADEYARFVQIPATISVSGSYYNFSVDGATTATGSFYGITDEIKGKITDGQKVVIYGYLSSISKQSGNPKFVNVVCTSIDTAPDFNNGLTSVIGSAKSGDTINAVACVTAISSQGPIVSDNSGSILLYKGTDVNLGDVVSIAGTVTSYNKGMQIAASTATIEKLTPMNFSYPYPMVLDGATMDTLLTVTDDFTAYYVEIEATISVSGNYYNFSVEGAATATGSFYGITDEMKAKVENGKKYTLRGYVSSISKQSGNPKFVNIIATDAIAASTSTAIAPTPMAAVVTPKSSIRYAIFQWNGVRFVSTDFAVLQPTDYAEMGQKYNNLEEPETYLPKYMNSKYPYGQEGDSKIVAFILNDGISSNWMAFQFISDGNVWTLNDGTVMRTDQFRRNEGVWKIDHTLILDYSEIGTAECKAFYQYCCNWVYDFVDAARYSAPARDNAGVIISTASVTVGGASPTQATFVSSYGNNEWYAGTYSYYGEINWSGSKAAASWAAAGYTLTEAEIIAKMQENCQEVFAGVLHYMYPEVTPDDYAKVVINVYDFVSKAVYSYSFTVKAKGEFEYIPDSFTKL